jgi:hypothetical protein
MGYLSLLLLLTASQEARVGSFNVFVRVQSVVNERGKVGSEDTVDYFLVLPAIFRGLSTSERDPATRLKDWERRSQWREGVICQPSVTLSFLFLV